MQFYQKLSELRKSAGLSQEELATKVGVSRQTVFKWESGLSSPSMDNILVLCRLFSVSADELIGNTPPKETKEKYRRYQFFPFTDSDTSIRASERFGDFRSYISMSASDFVRQRELLQSAILHADSFLSEVSLWGYSP